MKTATLRRMLFSLFVILSMAAAAAAPSGQATPDARATRVEKGLLTSSIIIEGRPVKPATIAERLAALKVPGVSVAVIENGAVEWAKGYGVLEAGSATPVTAETLFQAASISKPVAALGALRLVEQGKLALDENVNARLKAWKVPENEFTKTEKVTLRRLLSHTAGLTVHGFGGYQADAPVPTIVQVLDGQKPANSAAVRADVVPGSIWRYSGGGFTVMQLLASEAGGKPFPTLLSELVLKPVGMTSSTYEQPLPESLRKNAATGHRPNGNLLAGRYHTYPEMAAAGLWTTPTDLARFLIEIRKGLKGQSNVVSANTAHLMTTDVQGGYGLGLSLQGSGPAASFGHGGANEGFRCQMTAFIEKGQGAVIMTNSDRGGILVGDILRAIAREYDWPAFKPRIKKIVRVAPQALSPLTGRYQMRPGKTIDIVLEGEKLFIVDGKQKIELFPESETSFFELVEETDIVFEKAKDGKVSGLVINGNLRAPRVGDK